MRPHSKKQLKVSRLKRHQQQSPKRVRQFVWRQVVPISKAISPKTILSACWPVIARRFSRIWNRTQTNRRKNPKSNRPRRSVAKTCWNNWNWRWPNNQSAIWATKTTRRWIWFCQTAKRYKLFVRPIRTSCTALSHLMTLHKLDRRQPMIVHWMNKLPTRAFCRQDRISRWSNKLKTEICSRFNRCRTKRKSLSSTWKNKTMARTKFKEWKPTAKKKQKRMAPKSRASSIASKMEKFNCRHQLKSRTRLHLRRFKRLASQHRLHRRRRRLLHRRGHRQRHILSVQQQFATNRGQHHRQSFNLSAPHRHIRHWTQSPVTAHSD